MSPDDMVVSPAEEEDNQLLLKTSDQLDGLILPANLGGGGDLSMDDSGFRTMTTNMSSSSRNMTLAPLSSDGGPGDMPWLSPSSDSFKLPSENEEDRVGGSDDEGESKDGDTSSSSR